MSLFRGLVKSLCLTRRSSESEPVIALARVVGHERQQWRRPRHSPARTAPAIKQAVLALRTQHPTWGGRKLRVLLARQGIQAPARGTYGLLLRHPRIPQARVIRSSRPISPSGGMLRAGFTAAMAALRVAAAHPDRCRDADNRLVGYPAPQELALTWLQRTCHAGAGQPQHRLHSPALGERPTREFSLAQRLQIPVLRQRRLGELPGRIGAAQRRRERLEPRLTGYAAAASGLGLTPCPAGSRGVTAARQRVVHRPPSVPRKPISPLSRFLPVPL